MFKEMMDEVIKKYGFEAIETIKFCHECEVAEQRIEAIKKEVENIFEWYYK